VSGVPVLLDTLRRFESALERGSVEEVRTCFHDDAVIESVASDSHPLGPDATARAVAEALADGVYMIYGWQYEELGPEIILSVSRARYRDGGRAVRDETVYRLVSGRDGLMWRVKLFRARGDALAHLERHGPGLAI
jgi:hypothetical protein